MAKNTDVSIKLSQLLSDKESADKKVTEALKKRQSLHTPTYTFDEHGNQLYRTVAIIKRDAATKRLMTFLDIQKEANEALLKHASEYFDGNSRMFAVPRIIYDARKITLTTSPSASVRTVTAESIANAIKKKIQKLKLSLKKTDNPQEIEELTNKILDGEVQIDNLMSNPEKVYKRRSLPTKEVVALIRHRNPANSKDILPTEKHTVTTAGLIILRDRACRDSDISINDSTDSTRSVYEDIEPLETILDLAAEFYDSEQLDLVKAARAQRRDQNITKKRSQFDGNIV